MATMMNDTMAAARNIWGSARETSASAVDAAKSAAETAREGTEHAVSSAHSSLLDGAHVVTGVAAMLRSLTPDDALGWVGLARRRSPFLSFVVFSAGLAVGVGAGLLLAPTSGAKLRGNLFKALKGLLGDAKDVAESAEAKVEKIEDKAEKLAGKAKDKVEDLADKASGAAAKVEATAVAATSAVKDTFQDAKATVASAMDLEKDGQPVNGPNRPAHRQSGFNRPS